MTITDTYINKKCDLPLDTDFISHVRLRKDKMGQVFFFEYDISHFDLPFGSENGLISVIVDVTHESIYGSAMRHDEDASSYEMFLEFAPQEKLKLICNLIIRME